MAAEKGVKLDPGVWHPLLDDYRLTSLPYDTVVQGTLREGLSPDSPEVLHALEAWSGDAHLFSDERGRTELVLSRPT